MTRWHWEPVPSHVVGGVPYLLMASTEWDFTVIVLEKASLIVTTCCQDEIRNHPDFTYCRQCSRTLTLVPRTTPRAMLLGSEPQAMAEFLALQHRDEPLKLVLDAAELVSEIEAVRRAYPVEDRP